MSIFVCARGLTYSALFCRWGREYVQFRLKTGLQLASSGLTGDSDK